MPDKISVRTFLGLGPNEMPSMMDVESLYEDNILLRARVSLMAQRLRFLAVDFNTIARCAAYGSKGAGAAADEAADI